MCSSLRLPTRFCCYDTLVAIDALHTKETYLMDLQVTHTPKPEAFRSEIREWRIW